MSTAQSENEVFVASYKIGNGLRGAKEFIVNLLVSRVDNSVVGKGHIFQPTSQSRNVYTELNGTFNYQCTMKNCHIMLNLQGYQPYPGIPPVGMDLHNVTLRVLLNEDWKSGVAFYSYINDDGVWVEEENQRVTLLDAKQIKSVEQFDYQPRELAEA